MSMTLCNHTIYLSMLHSNRRTLLDCSCSQIRRTSAWHTKQNISTLLELSYRLPTHTAKNQYHTTKMMTTFHIVSCLAKSMKCLSLAASLCLTSIQMEWILSSCWFCHSNWTMTTKCLTLLRENCQTRNRSHWLQLCQNLIWQVSLSSRYSLRTA